MNLELSENVNTIHQRAESVDSAGSRSTRMISRETLVALEKTMLDNVVSRFSLIEEHEIHGNWRRIFLVMIVVIPCATFALFMWYFMAVACSTQTSTFLSQSRSTTLLNLIDSENVQYCGSFFSVPDLILAGNPPTYSVYSFTTYCCYVDGISYSTTGNCASAMPIGASVCPSSPVENSEYCLNNSKLAPFIVVYSVCTPAATALNNSINYALYSVVFTIYLYFAMRVFKKKGLSGLCSYAAWRSTLTNAKPDWMRKSHVAETV